MSDYLWIAAGVLVWLAAGLVITDVFGKACEEMEADDTSDMPPVERE